MTTLDLTDFGFPGKSFTYHGQIVDRRPQGARLLLLFREKHEVPEVIKPHILNAVALVRLGVVGCVGVEEHPFAYAHHSDAAVRQMRDEQLARHGSEDAVLDALGNQRFGQAVKLLCPEIPVQSVEDPVLREQADRLHERFVEQRAPKLLAPLLAEKARELGTTTGQLTVAQYAELEQRANGQAGEEFASAPVNVLRDGPMLANLLVLWQQTGADQAAILNAGGKHIDRLKHQLGDDVRYIVIDQP